MRIGLLGDRPPGLERLLADVAADLGFTLQFVESPADAAALVAVVSPADVVSVLCEARRLSAAPILALLAVGDERLARRATDCGARANWAMDTPLELLRFHLLTLLQAQPLVPSQPAPAPPFRLGARARALFDELRRLALGGEGRGRDPAAAQRLESAARLDQQQSPKSPFRFGERARRELLPLQLGPRSIAELERAITADLDESCGQVA